MKKLEDVGYRVRIHKAEYQVVIRYGDRPIPLHVVPVEMSPQGFLKAWDTVEAYTQGMVNSLSDGFSVDRKTMLGECMGQFHTGSTIVAQCIRVCRSFILEIRLVFDQNPGGYKDLKLRDAAISDFVALSFLEPGMTLEGLFNFLIDTYGLSAEQSILQRIFAFVEDREALDELTEVLGYDRVSKAMGDLEAYFIAQGK